MTILIIILGVALVASLAFNFGIIGDNKPALPASSSTSSSSSASPARADDAAKSGKSDAELEKKRKELDELRKSHNDLKDELKGIKKKFHEFKEEHKTGDDLARARGEVERQASIQLENTRAELATALSDLQRLRNEAEGKGKKRPERTEAAAEKPAEEKVEKAEKVEKPPEVVTRVIRELSETEKERIAKLEAQSANNRRKAIEADKELKNLKAKLDKHHRESKHVFNEGNLAMAKFRAVETRLNRTLMENDLLKRAIATLEKKTGLHAEHTQPTAEEIAESDRSMKEKHAAEDKASREALEKLEAAPVTPTEAAPVAATPTATPPAAEVAPAAPSAPTA